MNSDDYSISYISPVPGFDGHGALTQRGWYVCGRRDRVLSGPFPTHDDAARALRMMGGVPC